MAPTLNGHNGHDARGRFAKGNAGGPGNPHAKRANQLRTAMYEAVTEADVTEITGKLLALAKAGDLPAIKEVLDRMIGKPTPIVSVAEDEGERNKMSFEERAAWIEARLVEELRSRGETVN